jgi:hypothetical protein
VGASLVEAPIFIGSIRRESRHHLLTLYEASSTLFRQKSVIEEARNLKGPGLTAGRD